MYDYVIIGGGLAGCTLAYRLISCNKKVLVVDNSKDNISSQVAAGIVNPLTGKRTALSWNAAEIFEELHPFYQKLEQETHSSFFTQLPTYKLFDSIYEQNEWLNKHAVQGFNPFMESGIQHLDQTLIDNPFGALQISQTGRLNIPVYLQSMHQWLANRGAFLNQFVHFEDLSFENSSIETTEWNSKNIIFCDGAAAANNPFFSYLPHKPVHGELLEVEMPGFYQDRIINKGIFILPTGQNNYLVGATYNWDLKTPVTTEAGREELELKLSKLCPLNYQVLSHQAGIRPASNDRRPYLGVHPKYENAFFLGGLGSKGVSLLPYLSKIFTDYLLFNKELPREVDICRVKETYQN